MTLALHPMALHPMALHPLALHPMTLHPVALHPVALHPMLVCILWPCILCWSASSGPASCAVLQGSPSPIEYRWAVLNTAGTWPEILRRYVLSRSIASMPHRLVSPRVSSAASVLATQTAHVLTPDQHLVLLRSALVQLPAIKCQQHTVLLPESYVNIYVIE